MTKSFAANVASAIVGAIIGATIVLGVDGLTRPQRSEPVLSPSPYSSPSPEPVGRVAPSKTVLLAWAPHASGGLPASSERVLEKLPGVREVTTVLAGLDWIVSARGRDGASLDVAAPGFGVPIETIVIEPREYAAFVPRSERELVASLRTGNVLLAQTEAQLRGASEGARLTLRDGPVRVAGVVSDVAANGYEVLTAGDAPNSWSRVDRYVLIHLERSVARNRVERAVAELVGAGHTFRVRARGETPYLRYGDAVLPQMLVKKVFGEFVVRPKPDGSVEVDPQWKRDNIIEARVPLLGRITCHRVLIPQLRRAMSDLQDKGLDFLVDQFSGCYNPRFINHDPGGRLSHHAWGMAVDLNAAENQFGTRPDQDPRIVKVMEDWGFTWGGRWLVPDGMHFEWARFP